VIGLELGADDYVTKPFSPREVVARVRAVLRRVRGEPVTPEVLRVGPLVMDHSRREVTCEGRPIELTPTEFALLATLMAQPGRVFSRADLLEAVQGVAFETYERTIDAHIKNLRKKLTVSPNTADLIVTVRGVGYKLNATWTGVGGGEGRGPRR